jgi:hypothetical protein
MDSVQVKRRLVKSPPELWAELSDAQSLARRLGEFGEIRITRRQPETIVAWEGERASGTIEIESSGWGTAVIITAQAKSPPAPEPVAPPPAPEPVAEVPGPPAPPTPDPSPPTPGPEPVPTPPAPDPGPPSPGPPEPGPPPPPEPGPQIEQGPPRTSFLSRLFRRATEPVAETAPSPPVRPVEPIPETPPPVAPPAQPVVPEPEPEPAEPEPEPEPAAPEPEPAPEPLRPPERDDPLTPAASVDVQNVLETVLDDLGAAHHRPFSRA